MVKHFKKINALGLKSKILLSLLLLILAGFMSINIAMQCLTPKLPIYQQRLEHFLSKELKSNVHIGHIQGSWHWGLPIVVLEDLSLKNKQNVEVAEIDRVSFGINWWKSFVTYKWQPGFILVANPKLMLKQNKAISLDKLSSGNFFSIPGIKQSIAADDEISHEIFNWLSLQNQIVIKNLTLNIRQVKGGLLPVSKLSFNIVNKGLVHHIKLTFHLNQLTETNVYAIANLKGSNVDNLKGQIYLHGQDCLPAQWFNLLSLRSYKLTSGLIDFDSWIDVARGKVNSVKLNIKGKNLGFLNLENNERQLIQQIAAKLYSKFDNDYVLNIKDLSLRLGELKTNNNQLKIEKNKGLLTFSLNKLDLRLMNKIFPFFTDKTLKLDQYSQYYNRMFNTSYSGSAKDVDFIFKDKKLIKATGRIIGLELEEQKTSSVVKGLKFSYAYQDNTLGILLESNLTYLHAPFIIKNPTYLSSIKGQLYFSELNKSPDFCWRNLNLDHPYIKVSSNGCVSDFLNVEQARADLKVKFKSENGAKLVQYLPDKVIKPKLYDYLTQSILFAPNIKGTSRLKGRLKDFPFSDSVDTGSIFTVDASVSDLSFRYHKDWPVAVIYDSTLSIKNNSLNALIKKARTLNIQSENIRLKLVDLFSDEKLILNGEFNTTGDKASEFVKQSKLYDKIKVVDYFDIEGPVKVDLNLALSILSHHEDDVISGTLFLDNVDAKLYKEPGVYIKNLTGKVNFFEHGIKPSTLNGALWDSSVAISLDSLSQPPYPLSITIKSLVKTEEALKALHLQAPFLEGEIPMQVKIQESRAHNKSLFLGNLDLTPLKINLPEPFGKDGGNLKELAVSGEVANGQLQSFKAKIIDVLNFNYVLKGDKPSLKLILGDVPLDNWGEKFSDLQLSLDKKSWSKEGGGLANLNIDIKGLYCKSFKTPEFNLTFNPSKMGTELIFNGKGFSGNVFNPKYKRGTIVASFKEATFLSRKQTQEGLAPQRTVKSLPDLDLMVNNLTVNKNNYGELKLTSRNHRDLWVIEQFNLQNRIYKLALKGQWFSEKGKNNTDLAGYFQSTNVSETLKLFGKEGVVSSKNGLVKFHLSWPKALNSLTLDSATGQMSVLLKKGNITHLSKEMEEKIGIGKLLNILSLQTIPRRLVLDFNDLKTGLPFDVLSAELEAVDGDLEIRKAFMKGPVASAKIEGELSLIKQNYDVSVYLQPHVTSSLPVVATIAGGPLAGVATWLLSKVVSNGMQKSKAYAYQVKGPWNDPDIKAI